MNKRNDNMKKTIKDLSIFIFVILIYYLILLILDMTCPIKDLLGISCPGCGMSRALFNAIQFKFDKAFYYHPLWIVLPICVIILMISHYKNKKKIFYTCMISFSILLIIVYIYRMFNSDNYVVFFKPKEGLIYRIIEKIIKYIIELLK